MTKNRRIFPSAAPEPASPLTEAPRRKRKNWRSWLTIQVESERYQPPRSGILLLQVLVGIFFFVFVTRFWYLQLHLGPEMTTQAQKNRLRTERIFAPRGRIFDDHGNILADNRTAYGLAIIREDCPDIPATLAQISQWTDTPLEQLQNRYNQDRFKTKPFEALPLVSGLDFGQVARIEAELVNWPGLEIMVRTNRYYPEKDLFAHVLGYVAEANSAEMEKDPAISDEQLSSFGTGALRRAVTEGDDENGVFMCGQVAGLVKREQSCREILEEITAQAESVLSGSDKFILR